MGIERLEVDAPEVVAYVDVHDEGSARRLVVEACRLASTACSRDHPLLELGLARLSQAGSDDGLAHALSDLAERLDAASFDAQEAGVPEWDALFRSARLASALGFALRPQTRSTVLDAIYEAAHACSDARLFYEQLVP